MRYFDPGVLLKPRSARVSRPRRLAGPQVSMIR